MSSLNSCPSKFCKRFSEERTDEIYAKRDFNELKNELLGDKFLKVSKFFYSYCYYEGHSLNNENTLIYLVFVF